MIKNNKAFTAIEMMVTLAVIGGVLMMLPNFFMANVSMNKYFDVQALITQTRNLVIQNLQNKATTLRIMYDLAGTEGTELLNCLQEINPNANCTKFNMTKREILKPAYNTLQLRPDLAILNSKHGLSANCEQNCLFSIATSYRLTCRKQSCDSIEYLIKTEKMAGESSDISLRQISNHNDFIVLNKSDLKKNFTEQMTCNDPNASFLFSFNYQTRDGECRNCQSGPGGGLTSCFSPTGGFTNSGILKSGMEIAPKSIALDKPIPEKIDIKFDLQQATNGKLSRVEVTCKAGGSVISLPTTNSDMMMSSLRGSNRYQGGWSIDSDLIKSGSSYTLNCTMKGFSSSGFVVSLTNAFLNVYPTTSGMIDGETGMAPINGNNGSSTSGGGGFSVPSYSFP